MHFCNRWVPVCDGEMSFQNMLYRSSMQIEARFTVLSQNYIDNPNYHWRTHVCLTGRVSLSRGPLSGFTKASVSDVCLGHGDQNHTGTGNKEEQEQDLSCRTLRASTVFPALSSFLQGHLNVVHAVITVYPWPFYFMVRIMMLSCAFSSRAWYHVLGRRWCSARFDVHIFGENLPLLPLAKGKRQPCGQIYLLNRY